MCLRAPPERACELWVCFPFQLIEAVGWATEVTGFPPKLHEPIAFCMTPVVDRPLMPPDLLQGQFRQWFFVASLEQAAAKRPADKSIAVEVQLVACRLWRGDLPGGLRMQDLIEWWRVASVASSLPSVARIFSGPHPHAEDSQLQDIRALPRASVVRKTGHLLITVLPEMIGGGVKDENQQLAKTRVASLLLERGQPA